MAYVFTLLFLVSGVLLIISLISPKSGLFWKKGAVTRKQGALVYSIAIVVCLIGVGVTAPPDMKDAGGKTNAEGGNGGKAKDGGTTAVVTEDEKEYRLAESCDTNWAFDREPEKYIHHSGYIIDRYESTSSESDWTEQHWTIPTYVQTGPTEYKQDEKALLHLYEPVEVIKTMRGSEGSYDYHFLVVTRPNSTQQYIIDERSFSLKNPNACTLLQRAKNHFSTRAEYVPPSDPNNRPTDDRDHTWIYVPAGARILVREFEADRNTALCTLFDKDGELMVPDAHFYLVTLRQSK